MIKVLELEIQPHLRIRTNIRYINKNNNVLLPREDPDRKETLLVRRRNTARINFAQRAKETFPRGQVGAGGKSIHVEKSLPPSPPFQKKKDEKERMWRLENDEFYCCRKFGRRDRDEGHNGSLLALSAIFQSREPLGNS